MSFEAPGSVRTKIKNEPFEKCGGLMRDDDDDNDDCES